MNRQQYKQSLEEKLIATFAALRQEDFWASDVLDLLTKGGTLLLMSGTSPKGEHSELYAQFLAGSASFDVVPYSVVFFVLCGAPGQQKRQNLSTDQASKVRDMLYRS